MYGINRVGADGQLLTLIGSQNTDSGGNSMAPAVDDQPGRASHQGGPRQRRDRPGRHRRARHAVHQFQDDAIAVLESMTRLSHSKTDLAQTKLDANGRSRRCASWSAAATSKSTYLADNFRSPSALNPDRDPHIVAQAAQPARRHADLHDRPSTTPTANSARPRPS